MPNIKGSESVCNPLIAMRLQRSAYCDGKVDRFICNEFLV